jgi:hypothetical protein
METCQVSLVFISWSLCVADFEMRLQRDRVANDWEAQSQCDETQP